jgi:NADH dehydrogenase FAD-containing subunit
VAVALDQMFNVVLIEPKDAFVHSVAALRGLVDADFVQHVFYPYDRLLNHGLIIRDRAVRIAPNGVELASGERLSADYIVLATGSYYPFPAKMDVDDRATALQKLASARSSLAAAKHVLLVGAGPVGLELAGEISDVWPSKRVTVVDATTDILAGRYDPLLRVDLRRQLAERGVNLVLGAALTALPPIAVGTLEPFSATTENGVTISADIWFRCFGVRPESEYLRGTPLASARRPDGAVEVTDDLRVLGQERIFALGDVTAVREQKRAGAAQKHAAIIAENINDLAAGRVPSRTYVLGPDTVVLPLGRRGGASQIVGPDGLTVIGADATSQRKGADLLSVRYAAMFGLT